MFENVSSINNFLKNFGHEMMSQYPKILTKMNTYLYSFLSFFDVIDPAAGKSEAQKSKRRTTKTSGQFYTSPDCLNIRASVRKQNNVRHNPAP